MNFEWNITSSDWERNFDKLLIYKKDFGDCLVSNKSKTHKELGIWVAYQRRAYFDGRLSLERTTRLEEIGFIWDPLACEWEQMFACLKDYKNIHGNCNVPQRYKLNLSLGGWVNTQRKKYRKGNLPEDFITKLEAIGFEWKIRR